LYHAHVHPKKYLPEKHYGQHTVGNLSTLLHKLLLIQDHNKAADKLMKWKILLITVLKFLSGRCFF